MDQKIETEIAKSDLFSMTVDRDDFCVLLMPPQPLTYLSENNK